MKISRRLTPAVLVALQTARDYHARMDQSPAQAAEQEQAKRQAAFERARRKLAAARSGKQATFVPPPKQLSQRILIAFTVVFYLVLFGAMLWFTPEMFDPRQWGEHTFIPTVAGVSLVIILFTWVLQFRGRALHPAESALRSFYNSIGVDSKVAGLADLVVSADLDRAPRRAPAFDCGIPPAPRIDSPAELDRYWETLCKPDGKPRYSLNVKRVKLQQIAGDLVLASLKLRILKNRPNFAMLLMAIPVIPAALIADKLLPPPWSAMLTTISILASFWVVAFVALREVAVYRVRKLIVHSAGKWRMFCGDWEGWEEADLSWLDEPAV